MDALPRKHLTQEEYLAIERAAQWKSEYYQGEMFAMAGTSRNHARISFNMVASAGGQLLAKGCEGYVSDMRVLVQQSGLYTYPDIAIVCGKPEFQDAQLDTLLNPVAIIEILSPSTEAYDRGEKFRLYRQLASLKEYVLVSQEKAFVDQYIRDEEGRWFVLMTQGIESVLTLQSCGVSIPMRALYDRVEFSEGMGKTLQAEG
ncbi:MAG: Uma2 family endonuclease [Armatimonadetes bacterium]|nr:Uma2 family endonuclease [Armatimonadota bacterium]